MSPGGPSRDVRASVAKPRTERRDASDKREDPGSAPDAREGAPGQDARPKTLAPAHRSAYASFLPIPTRWLDNDVYGHVNNVIYYAYFDTVVNEHLIRAAGLDIRHGNSIGLVVDTACGFHKPLSFPETIDAGLRVARIGRSSVHYEIALFREGDDEAAATGRFVHVWVDRASRRPVPVPDAVRAAVESLAVKPPPMPASASVERPPGAVTCAAMTRETRDAARRLLGDFLASDTHYRASAAHYGDGGRQALELALDLFLARPEIGFVWLALCEGEAVGACVVCYAISTSRGGVVAKLDDVTIDARHQGQGVGTAMLAALFSHLRERGLARVDTACHRENADAWRFYERLGFHSLDEERIARLL